MHVSGLMSCRTDELSLSEKCSQQSRDAHVGFSGIAAPAIENRRHKEASRQPRGQAADFDSRTHMLLEKPIATTIMRLAIPNAAVMTVQVLIGLLEVYFVSRTGVDALAGVIADAILFVASDKASYITGQIIRVNGGKTAS